jgi:hypothetical protein
VSLVAALGLPQRGVRARHVENVVDDLKQDPELGGVLAIGGCRGTAHACYEQYALYRRADQSTGLQLVQAPQRAPGVRLVGPDRGDVEILAAHHPVDPGRRRQRADRGQHVGGLARLMGQQMPEGLGIEPVAGEDRNVLAESHVIRRPAPAHVVVVHRRQVVVDERVRVDELDRGGQRQQLADVLADRTGGREGEDRPDALAARQQAVAHRLDEPVGERVLVKRQAFELVFDQAAKLVRVRHGG